MNRQSFVAAICLASIAIPALAAQPPADRRNFVSCPIMRDTNTVPCWLAEHDGELYYLGVQVDFSSAFWPPFMEHKVLVEGQVSDEARICGGKVLKSVKLSSLPERDESCKTILPAEDRYTIPFKTRGPGPNDKPSRDINAPRPPAPTAEIPKPYKAREFTVLYDFDNRIWNVRAVAPMNQAQTYAKAIKAKEVEIVGYRGASLLSDGSVLAEDKGVGEMRAKQLEQMLRQVGISGQALKVRWVTAAAAPNGVDDPLTRKAVITVKP